LHSSPRVSDVTAWTCVWWIGASGWMVSRGRNASEQGPDRSGGYAAILTFRSECETSFDLTVCTGVPKILQ